MPTIIFAEDRDPAARTLCADLARARPDGALSCAFATLASAQASAPLPTLDAFASHQGYGELGTAWIEIRRRIAERILAQILGFGLAYPDELLPVEQASALTGRFLARFPEGSHFYTNGICTGDPPAYALSGEQILGWRSLSQATFDNGVIALGAGLIGMIWAEAELEE